MTCNILGTKLIERLLCIHNEMERWNQRLVSGARQMKILFVRRSDNRVCVCVHASVTGANISCLSSILHVTATSADRCRDTSSQRATDRRPTTRISSLRSATWPSWEVLCGHFSAGFSAPVAGRRAGDLPAARGKTTVPRSPASPHVWSTLIRFRIARRPRRRQSIIFRFEAASTTLNASAVNRGRAPTTTTAADSTTSQTLLLHVTCGACASAFCERW